jgi:hypothetical protein
MYPNDEQLTIIPITHLQTAKNKNIMEKKCHQNAASTSLKTTPQRRV